MSFDSLSRRWALLGLVTLGLSALVAPQAGAEAPIQDKEYKLITTTAKPAPGKVEVIEFFSYACPHCAEFEAPLRAWLKNKPQDVDFKTVPVIFRDNWAPLAKLHFTLESMGQIEKLHGKVFQAMHGEHIDLADNDKLYAWLGKQGVDVEKFKQIYTSFGIDARIEGFKKMAREYNVQFTPVIAVQGKYITGPSMAVGADNKVNMTRFFQVVDALIAQERAKNPAPKADKPAAKPKAEKARADKPA